SDPRVFELTQSNLRVLGQGIELVHGNYAKFLADRPISEDRGIVVFVAPPWGRALEGEQGLDLGRTIPPVADVIDQFVSQFTNHKLLFAIQIFERTSEMSMNGVRAALDWTDLRFYAINRPGRNHGLLLGTRGWMPR